MMLLRYDGVKQALAEAYRNTVSQLIQILKNDTPMSFAPFVY
jgi:hypothetical protein